MTYVAFMLLCLDLLSGSTSAFVGTPLLSRRKSASPNAKQSGHDFPDLQIEPEELKIQQSVATHQMKAPKLSFPTDVRTIVEYNHGFAVMSTNSKANPGYPGGSVVGFAPDAQGRPLFVFSGLSSHTRDLVRDGRCSVTIATKEFKGAADSRVNLMGSVSKIPRGEEVEAAKVVYLKKHPTATWVNFGDFNWFRMDEIIDIRFVGGFGRAGDVSPEEYFAAEPDEISAIGMFVANHMNEDHSDATIAMIEQQIPGFKVDEAIISSVDSLGMYVKVTRSPHDSDEIQKFKLRLPFPRPAKDRKDIKNIIVEMTRAAARQTEEEVVKEEN